MKKITLEYEITQQDRLKLLALIMAERAKKHFKSQRIVIVALIIIFSLDAISGSFSPLFFFIFLLAFLFVSWHFIIKQPKEIARAAQGKLKVNLNAKGVSVTNADGASTFVDWDDIEKCVYIEDCICLAPQNQLPIVIGEQAFTKEYVLGDVVMFIQNFKPITLNTFVNIWVAKPDFQRKFGNTLESNDRNSNTRQSHNTQTPRTNAPPTKSSSRVTSSQYQKSYDANSISRGESNPAKFIIIIIVLAAGGYLATHPEILDTITAFFK